MSGSTSGGINIGSGSDSITLQMAEDQALGVDAEFTVNVDGQQVGGLQTATAAQSSGQSQTFTFNGNWAPGSHDVTVTFANNFIYPGQSGDRNLYVNGVSYDGSTVSSTTTPIYQSPLFPPNSTDGNIAGNAVFSVNDTTPIPSGAGPAETTSPGAVSVGDGPDTLVLGMAEDAYQGDAQFTVSVDGKQVGGTLTTTALIAQGQSQEFDVHGDFGSGSHTVSVNFLNDQIGDFYPAGTPGLPPGGQWAVDTTDRNLYVTSVTLNGGAPAGGTPWELSSSGSKDFSVTAGSGSGTGSSSASGSGTGSGSVSADTGSGSGTGSASGSNAGTSDTTTVSSDSLSAGSSDSMNFVAPTATTADSTGSSASGTSSDSSTGSASSLTGSAGSSTDTSQTTPSAQDFNIPSPGGTGVTYTSSHDASVASLLSQLQAQQNSWLAGQPA